MTSMYIHPAALVESQTIGDGTRIWAFTHVLNGVSVGVNCNIGEHCFLETGAAIGNDVTIKNGNEIWDGVTIEDGAFIGPNVSFTNDLYPRSARLSQAAARYRDRRWLLPTLVREGASIGAGAIIVAGNTIGAFATVGAGSVVTRDVPAHALVVGAPARTVGWVCECGHRLHFIETKATCRECSREFVRTGDQVRATSRAAVFGAGI